MARPKKNPEAPTDQIFPNGMSLGTIQLERDLNPKPSGWRITQLVNRDGKYSAYVSENAYQRSECTEIYRFLYELSKQNSLEKGAVSLFPVKSRFHWKRFTIPFCLTGEGERINPETDKPEAEEVN